MIAKHICSKEACFRQRGRGASTGKARRSVRMPANRNDACVCLWPGGAFSKKGFRVTSSVRVVGEFLVARCAHGVWRVARRTGCMTVGFVRFQIRSWLQVNVATLRVPPRPVTSQKPLLHNRTTRTFWLPMSSGGECCGGFRMERHQRCQDADEDG